MAKGKKNIIGILGGIASGKSTVAGELAQKGCDVIDADLIAKQFLLYDAVKSKIRLAFGEDVFDSGGCIDNRLLADKVFSSAESVRQVNSIIHPPVLARIEELIAEYSAGPSPAIVIDAPLLLEVGLDKKCDKLVFVSCDVQLRAQRATKRGFFDEKELKKRENFQISLDKKAAIAHYTLNNNDLSGLIEQIGNLFPALISQA